MIPAAHRLAITAALLLWGTSAMAQLDSTRAGRTGEGFSLAMFDTNYRNAFLSMNRSVNTFLWTINSGLAGAAAGGRYVLGERITASMIPEIGQAAAQRTDADVRLGLSYPFIDGWSMAGTSTLQSITDNRNIGINNVARVGAMGGVEGRPSEDLRVAGQAGAISDRQIGLRDMGTQYLGEIQLAPVNVNDYTFWGRVVSAQEFITPRRNTTQNAEVNAALRSPTTELRAHADIIHNERDFYFADSASAPYTGHSYNIEQRIESGLHGGFLGDYLTADAWRLRFEGDVTDRMVTRHDAYKSFALPGSHIDTRVKEFKLSGAGSISGEIFGAAVAANLRYEEYEESHSVAPSPENSALALQQQSQVESQKNSVARRTQLGGGLGIPFGLDSLVFSVSMGILHYDTPDTSNTDDRDELDMVFHAAYSTHPFPGCTWGVRADMFLHHLVYIFSAQSGNNAWNRIIRLNPFITIVPSHQFRTVASFDVLGNYTAFDFEPQLQSLHGYSFRQLALRDSSEFDLTSTIRAMGFIEMRWYEHGQLNYVSFRERPIDRVQEWTYGAGLQKMVVPGLRVGAGIRAFARYVSAYGGVGTYSPTVDLRAFGPTALVAWNAERFGILTIDGWYEIIREGALSPRTVPNFLMTVQWML